MNFGVEKQRTNYIKKIIRFASYVAIFVVFFCFQTRER